MAELKNYGFTKIFSIPLTIGCLWLLGVVKYSAMIGRMPTE